MFKIITDRDSRVKLVEPCGSIPEFLEPLGIVESCDYDACAEIDMEVLYAVKVNGCVFAVIETNAIKDLMDAAQNHVKITWLKESRPSVEPETLKIKNQIKGDF